MLLVLDLILLGSTFSVGLYYAFKIITKRQYDYLVLFGIFWVLWIGMLLNNILLQFNYGIGI